MSAAATVERWWALLRAQGVAVDPRQLDAAMRVAMVLEATGKSDRLFASVQGVLTKNEGDLATLRTIAGEAWPGEQILPTRGIVARSARWRWRATWIAAALALVAALLAWHLWPTPQPARQPITQTQLEPPPPENGSGLRVSRKDDSLKLQVGIPVEPLPALLQALILALPPLVIAALFLLWRAQAPRWVHLSLEESENRLYNNLPDTNDAGLFRSNAIRLLGRALDARAADVESGIDVARTVEATARAGGMLDIVHLRPMVESPIHFAIERKSRDDHLSELYFRLADQLRSYGAYVQVTHFRDDLGNRFDEAGTRAGAPLPDPCEVRAVIAVIGEGDMLFDPLGTRPQAAQLTHLRGWQHRILLSTRPAALWGDREAALETAGVALAPATSRGLSAFAELLWKEAPLNGVIGVKRIGA